MAVDYFRSTPALQMAVDYFRSTPALHVMTYAYISA